MSSYVEIWHTELAGGKNMAMKKKPVTGMKDILPKEMEIRDYVIGLIKEKNK